MNKKDIIIDPIITHNNYLIEVAPDEFVNVTQLWKECKQIVKDKKDLQNRIDKAIEFIEKNSKQCLTHKIDEQPTKAIGKFMWHIDDLLDILKESGE